MAADDPILKFYSEAGATTSLGHRADLIDALPSDLAELCAAIQGLIVHRNWLDSYGEDFTAERAKDAQARSVMKILERILSHDGRPLPARREPAQRFAGTCRDFSVMTCAILRHQGYPARARAGFGTYFEADKYIDHWICEHWSEREGRWVQTDAQIDALQNEKLALDFDPLDVPLDRFLNAGEVWRRCRAGEIEWEKCGIFDLRGEWFVRNNVVRDLAALNRVELLPWDDWGLMLRAGKNALSLADRAKVDRAAEMTCAPDANHAALRRFFQSDTDFMVPDHVKNWETGDREFVEL